MNDAGIHNMNDLIDRQAAIDELEYGAWGKEWDKALAKAMLESLPSVQPVAKDTNVPSNDCISRQEAIDACLIGKSDGLPATNVACDCCAERIRVLPSAQPERTCVNCGRTVNNGGWYADGGTRCPIEEHYALPKDGYCHLWEKRNVTDDNYPERREE